MTEEIIILQNRIRALEGQVGSLEELLHVYEEKVIEQSAKLEQTLKQLGRTNQNLEEFAYVISHDLRAPLRAIINLAQWIQEDIGENISEGVANHIKLMQARVLRMESLINGVLEYSRVGRTELIIETVNTRVVVEEIINNLDAPKNFTITIDPNLPIIQTSLVQISQVFTNLISNAIRYNDKEQGIIEISAKKGVNFYEFFVKDNGPGIEPKFHEKVFMLFQTLAARDKKESTGIGLTIVKKIVENLGGEIKLESDKNMGANFKFKLPHKIS